MQLLRLVPLQIYRPNNQALLWLYGLVCKIHNNNKTNKMLNKTKLLREMKDELKHNDEDGFSEKMINPKATMAIK